MSDNSNIDDFVNSTEPDLSAYIQSQEYGTVPFDDSGVTGTEAQDTPVSDTEDLTSQQIVQGDGEAGQADTGNDQGTHQTAEDSQGLTTPQTQQDQGGSSDQNLVAEIQRREAAMMQLLQQQAVDRIRQSDERFEASLQDMDELEAANARLERVQQQARVREQFLTQQIQDRHRADTYAQEQSAKNQIAYIYQQQYNLPLQAVQSLLRTGTPQDMEALAMELSQYVPQQDQQQPQQQPQQQQRPQRHPNADRAGGSNATNANLQEPKQYSGDLMSLITSRGYHQVSQQ